MNQSHRHQTFQTFGTFCLSLAEVISDESLLYYQVIAGGVVVLRRHHHLRSVTSLLPPSPIARPQLAHHAIFTRPLLSLGLDPASFHRLFTHHFILSLLQDFHSTPKFTLLKFSIDFAFHIFLHIPIFTWSLFHSCLTGVFKSDILMLMIMMLMLLMVVSQNDELCLHID